MVEVLLSGLQLYCPACKNQLRNVEGGVYCSSCNLKYPRLLDILDLRYPRPEISKSEQSQIDEMTKGFTSLSFEELLQVFLREAQLSKRVIKDTLKYYRTQTERAEKMVGMFFSRYKEFYGSFSTDYALDVGCGSGGGAIALAKRCKEVFGVDSHLSQLILAKKLIAQSHISNVSFICAYAQRLPFGKESFGFAQGINVIEHMEDMTGVVLREIWRCLESGGGFAADSRNRFDIFLPEPHSGIRFLGFLPRRWIPGFVRRITGNHYEHTRLLSYREIEAFLMGCFDEYLVVLPYISAYGKPIRMDRWVRAVEQCGILNRILLCFFSAHLALARKR